MATEGEYQGLRTSLTALDAQVARSEANQDAERRSHMDREQELQRTNEQLYALRSEIQSLESRLEYERREREGLLRLAGEREVEVGELETPLGTNEALLHEALQESARLDERLESERTQLTEREGGQRELQERMSALQGRQEAMQAPLRYQKLAAIRGRERDAAPPTIGRRARPRIHRHIEDPPGGAANQLGLREGGALVMQSTQRARIARQRVVVLAEIDVEPDLCHARGIPTLRKPATVITDARGCQNHHSVNIERLYPHESRQFRSVV